MFLIIISIVLFLLLAAVELYVQSDTFALRIRPYVVEPLKAALGEGAEIGKVKANFIPLYIEVRDLSLPDDKGVLIVAVRKVKVYINPLPLFLKKIRLFSISILEPRIYAGRAKDGVANFMPFLERIKSNIARTRPEGRSRFELLLRTITITNGRIVFADDVTPANLALTGINMTVRVDLSQERVRAAIRGAQVRISSPAFPELAGRLKATLEYRDGALRMDPVELSLAESALVLSGTVGLPPEGVLDLRVSVTSGVMARGKLGRLMKPAQKREVPRIEAVALIRGKTSDPVIDGSFKASDLSFRGMQLKDAAVSFTYRNRGVTLKGEKWKLAKGGTSIIIDSIDTALEYAGGGLDIRRFVVLSQDLSFRLEGRLDPSTGFDLDLSAGSSGNGKTITFLTSLPLKGLAGVRGKLTGLPASPRFDGTIAAGPVTVRGILFNEVRGGIEFADKKIRLVSVDIQERSSRYVLDGAVDFNAKEPYYIGRLRVVRSDVVNVVALFYKHLPLRLPSEGELSFAGTAENYTGSGFLKLSAGSAYGESFSRGAITAKLSTGRISFPQVVLYKENGKVKASGWIGFDGTYSAELEGRDVDLSSVDHLAGMLLGGGCKVDVHSSGSFSNPYVKASLEVDELSYRQVSAGGMNAEAEIKDGLFTALAGLSDGRANLSIEWALHTPYVWTAEARIKSDAIDPFLFVGKGEFTSRVNVVAAGVLRMRGKGLDPSALSGEAIFHKLSLGIGDFRIENESDANLSVAAGRIAATSLNFTGPVTRIAVTGGIKLFSEIDLTLKGTANLSFLKLLYHEVEQAGGVAEVKLTVKNDLKNPDVAGELLIQDGEIKVKDIPQRFTAMNGRIVFSEGGIVADSLSGVMGGGKLNVSGWAQFAGGSLQDFSAKAAVDNVTVRYPEGLVSTLSGELYYDGNASEQSLSGDITIKRARYDKRIEWKTMLVDIGRSLYQKRMTDVGWIGDTQINVRFHGANTILFENNLAKMPLDADVFLRGTVNHPQLLGRIEARKGVVYFRKNEFKILNASVDFVDPNRMNPSLDIQAETRVREYLIRLGVTGTAEHAMITLISEPSLMDTDILALLALGKTGAELRGKEAGVGVGEATSFATGRFQDVIERNAKSLTGLDRFQVDPYVGKNDTSVPRVTVGKELMKNKLYATYSSNVGAAMPEQMLRIEYMLDRHFSLVGERNEMGNNGADIKYRFEFR